MITVTKGFIAPFISKQSQTESLSSIKEDSLVHVIMLKFNDVNYSRNLYKFSETFLCKKTKSCNIALFYAKIFILFKVMKKRFVYP